jgi:hypothetical protein
MPNRKSELYNALKSQGWVPEKHYRQYNVGELEQLAAQSSPAPEPEPAPISDPLPDLELPPGSFFGTEPPAPPRQNQADPDEMAGQRLNTKDLEDVIRVDEHGRQWLQEEVRKPAYPKPRGRRVLQYQETGTQTQTIKSGEYTETFEVAGKGAPRASEVKITLPSFQVGIYRDPRFPFKVITYDSRDGFDMFDVQNYYGGSELVPPGVKRIYIENVLCYDVRSVIQAINAEYRHLQLTGRIK